ncbi:MAG: hypothetical protein Q4Q53_08100 [Methanocorpusculum sp.]|nr:hypothetical protein [Methanocorpusculum sp.]
MIKSGYALIISVILLTTVISAGCVDTTSSDLIPAPAADLSGTWKSVSASALYGDGDITTLNETKTIHIDQSGRTFYLTGDLIDGTGVGVFCNEKGTTFMSDISTDGYRGIICGESRGDEIMLSYTGAFTKDYSGFTKGSVFVETYHFVREGKKPTDTFVITPLDKSYPFAKGFILSQEKEYETKGDILTVDKQKNGIISGTIDNYRSKVHTRSNYTGGYMFTDVDGNGLSFDSYIIIDEDSNKFWIMNYFPSTNDAVFMTVATAVYPELYGEVVAGFEIYGEDAGYSNETFGVKPISLLGTWEGFAVQKIKADKVKEEFYPGFAKVVSEKDVMFTGSFFSENVPKNDIAGSLLTPTSREFFMAGPKAGDANSVFVVRGWADGDTLYACGIYESFGVKTATVEVFKRVNETA